ncbi:zf-HC2 domain-containing protein [Cellulomonas sp. ATA003]|uniref:anti-sigma factor family protein n=1 Tax=Cellulomonas sp. ATA003 TaxID=3073064 RepID=UPI0028733FE7|nr:zf-HC2 domain-containing protein [Cellulomonas sp. ATA003]WNB85005.1 zf-HC2 domain-containing protein [Cellulomonas sp. ATA003]
MSHLGTWVSALVDGQLSPAETERALAHVAACPACADEVAAARQARRVLSVTRDVAPDPALTARLLALAADAQPPTTPRSRERHRPVVPLGESAYSLPARALSGDLGRRRSPRRTLVGALAGVGVFVGVLFVAGDRPAVVPATHPAAALTALGRAPQEAPVHRGVAERQLMATIATTSGVSSGTAAADAGRSTDETVLAWMRAQGWSCPDTLPPGYDVTAVRLGGDAAAPVLEVDLAGPYGRAVLTEQHGRLDVASLGPVEEVTIDGRTLYVLSRHPWHAVWQSDDTVVTIVSEAPPEEAVAVVQHFPVQGYDDGLPARLTRGWDTVTGAIAP